MSKSYLRNVIGEYMTVLGEKNRGVVIVNADLGEPVVTQTFANVFHRELLILE